VPDVSSCAPADVRLWVALDTHKLSIVAATLPRSGGQPQLHEIENTPIALRRLVDRLGGGRGLAVCYEAGPVGWQLKRQLDELGVACDVIAPSLIPVRAGERIKTDRRDAKRLVRLFRAGELTFVAPPSPEQEGLRDLVRCREDLRDARMRARHRAVKQLTRHGHVFRDGKHWTLKHRAWLRCQRLADPLSQRALEHMLAHLDAIDAQIRALDGQLEQAAGDERWRPAVQVLCAFRGISTRTALGLLAEIGDFRRFGSARELMSYLGLVPSEHSSGQERHRGHITKAGPKQARRLLIEAAWHYRHAPRLSERQRAAQADLTPQLAARAWHAQVRLRHRHHTLTEHGRKRPTITNVAVARELTGFLWAAMTDQPPRPTPTAHHTQHTAAAA
jgi:transposase